jgi:hypothetical protein
MNGWIELVSKFTILSNGKISGKGEVFLHAVIWECYTGYSLYRVSDEIWYSPECFRGKFRKNRILTDQ